MEPTAVAADRPAVAYSPWSAVDLTPVAAVGRSSAAAGEIAVIGCYIPHRVVVAG